MKKSCLILVVIMTLIGFTFSGVLLLILDDDDRTTSDENRMSLDEDLMSSDEDLMSSDEEYSESTSTSPNKRQYANYQDAIEAGDYEAAHEILDQMHTAIKEGNTFAWDNSVRSEYRKYLTAMENVYKREIKDLLINDPEGLARKIPIYLSDIPEDGNPTPAQNIDKTDDDIIEPLVTYMAWSQSYNNICKYALEQAVNIGNKELARKILSFFKHSFDMKCREIDRGAYFDNYVDFKETYAAKKAAERYLKEH